MTVERRHAVRCERRAGLVAPQALAGGVCGVFAIYTELVRIRKLLQGKEKEPESGTKPEPKP